MTDGAGPQPLEPIPPEQAVAEFHAVLRTVTPRAWVVPSLVLANVAVFGIMVVRGVSPFLPRGEDLVTWGANFGPATLSGEPWRLVASAFLHFGALHLAMNMVALWSAGGLVERIFGQARFATIYLFAAVCGSAASVLVHPQAASAGASGAVFGVYGALAGFLLRERNAIPAPVLSGLKRVALGFIGYNLVFGLVSPNVDASAHVGGLVAGALAGAFLSRPLAVARRGGAGKNALVAALSLAAVAAAYLAPMRQGSLEVRRLPGFAIALPSGSVVDDSGAAYAAGRHVVRASASGSALVAVAWQPGTLSRDELDPFASAFGRQVGVAGSARIVKVPGPDGIDVDTVVVDGDRARMRVSALACGRRTVIVATVGSTDPGGLHLRIVPTFACQPDPQLDAVVDVVPLMLELPGWSATDRAGGQLVLSDGRSTALIRNWPIPSRASIADIAALTFTGIGATVDVTPVGSDTATVTGTFGGEHMEGWIRVLRCPSAGVLLVVVAPDPSTSERLGAAARGARCTAPGEAPSSWPDAPGR